MTTILNPTSKVDHFTLCLVVSIRTRDADALHSLIDGGSEDETFARKIKRAYPKISALISPEEEEWFRLQLGGEDERPRAIALKSKKLIPLSQVQEIVGVDYFCIKRFLANSRYRIFVLWRRDRVVVEAIAPSDLLRICLDLVIFLTRERIERTKK